MTVIVGVASEGKVYMAADRGTSEKGFLGSSTTHKIKRINDMIVGYSGSRGTGQLAFTCTFPAVGSDLETWLRVDFANTIQTASELFKLDINGEDNSASFLVGVQGRVFEISSQDWSVSEYPEIATGSGYAYAMGSLYSSRDLDPKTRVRLAVGAAIAYSPECAKPVDVLVL